MKKTFITILILSLPFVSWGQEEPKTESTEASVESVETETPLCIVGETETFDVIEFDGYLNRALVGCGGYCISLEDFNPKAEKGVEILRPMEGTGFRTSGNYLRNTPRR
ncbi:MAG: hypothetical protein HWE14_02775 [Flavobacteriia bacterium]|nr:hypothetical protein [Flavobacteriia bacterium]